MINSSSSNNDKKKLLNPNSIYGKGATEAWKNGLCISCRKEFEISGLCEECFDKNFDY